MKYDNELLLFLLRSLKIVLSSYMNILWLTLLRITAVKLGVTLLVNEIWKTRERVPPAATPLKVQILVIDNTIAAFKGTVSPD
jgi:hypothetical protein